MAHSPRRVGADRQSDHHTASVLLDAKVAVGKGGEDGEGGWRGNVFVERPWRSVEYEDVFLRAYDSASEARVSIGRYLAFYDERRPHSSLDGRTPDEAYFEKQETVMAACPRRFCRSSGRAMPSRRHDKIETFRVRHTPAEIHLKSAGPCPDNRGQLRL